MAAQGTDQERRAVSAAIGNEMARENLGEVGPEPVNLERITAGSPDISGWELTAYRA